MEIKDMFAEEPAPEDMNDPDVQEELFMGLFEDNVKPEGLPDQKNQKLYKVWLKRKGFSF